MNSQQLQNWIKEHKKPSIITGSSLGFLLLLFFYIFFFPNTNFKAPVADYYVTKNMSYDQLKMNLSQNNLIDHRWTFDIAALFYHLEYDYQIGLFQIPKNSSNREILLLLTRRPKKNIIAEIRSFRKRKNVLTHFCKQLDIKYSAISDAVQDTVFLKDLGQEFNSENIYTIFIPDTIPVYKNTRAKEVLFQLVRHYRQFWTPERESKAAQLGLTCEEVCILASIVKSETHRIDEMPRIAGLYINRLRSGKRLQADPTVTYALGYSVKRIRHRHTKIKSPYNTYRNKGLPPGPVTTPSTDAIDAVLNMEEHDYFFFCAKPDNSGYHSFSKTYKEHLALSKEYHSMLNRKGIK